MVKRVLIVLILSVLLIFSSPVYSEEQQPGGDFASAIPLDLSTGSASVNGSLIKPFEDNHYYMITGLSSGVQVIVYGTLKGIEPGLTTVSLYSSIGARLAGKDQLIGKDVRRRVELKYLLAYDPRDPEPVLYIRVGKSTGALNYSLEIVTNKFFDAGMGRDAGGDMQNAIPAPTISRDALTVFKGYLSEEEYGNDYSDFYKLTVNLQPKDEIYIEIDPNPQLMIWASLLTLDGFSLRHNKSENKGDIITLRVRGDWKPGVNTFYLRVENLGGSGGGGEYIVNIRILSPVKENATTTTPSEPQPWPILSQETIRNIIIGIAVVVVAVAVIVLVIRRRRRVVRVEEEEWGGWGGEEIWEER
ncbi:MAG: hypothetical protein NZ929_01785 [Aigarchaeota archaeon]|nr:hypothetical protein [Aigarchaeota archaeon]